MAQEQKVSEVKVAGVLDARGKACPEPNMMIKEKLSTMNPGDVLEVIGDMGAKRSGKGPPGEGLLDGRAADDQSATRGAGARDDPCGAV